MTADSSTIAGLVFSASSAFLIYLSFSTPKIGNMRAGNFRRKKEI
jgi:hypothetical protein